MGLVFKIVSILFDTFTLLLMCEYCVGWFVIPILLLVKEVRLDSILSNDL